MITAPEVPDFQADNFKVNDRREAVIKDNNRNRKLDRFAAALSEMVNLANAEFKFVAETRIEITQKSSQVTQDRQHVDQQKNAIDSVKTHVDQQKKAIDTTAGQVSSNAQQVASDKAIVAKDKQATSQSASAANSSASAAQQAKQAAEDLYGDLDAVRAARTGAQQSATTAGQQAQVAGQERNKAETARSGAEEALRQALEAAQAANVDIDKALENYVVKDGAFTWNGQRFGTVKVHDARDIDPAGRNSEYVPEPDQLGSTSLSALFSTGLPGHSWRSAILVNGWTPTYTPGRITGPSGTSVDDDFFVTSGKGSAWGPDRRLWHDGNLDPEDAANLKKGAIPAARIVSTPSRTHSGTGVMLEARAMNDHRVSGDHDGRYARIDAENRHTATQTFRGSIYIEGPNGAYARTNARDDGDSTRLYSYTTKPGGNTAFNQAWYGGSTYTNVTTTNDGVEFDKSLTTTELKLPSGVGLKGAANGLEISRSAGSVEIGNRNSSYTHYNSSAGAHYFYGRVYSQSGFYGDGSGLTNLNAGAITAGTMDYDRVPSTSSRFSSSTAHALNAAAMNAHRTSGDHDAQYIRRTDFENGWNPLKGVRSSEDSYNPASDNVLGFAMGLNGNVNGYGSFQTDGSVAPMHLGSRAGYNALIFYANGNGVGRVQLGSSSVVYYTTSDYRLKDSHGHSPGTLDKVLNVPVHSINFKADPAGTHSQESFLAHELQREFPAPVSGVKDEVEDCGRVLDSKGGIVAEDVSAGDFKAFYDAATHQWKKTGTKPVYQNVDYPSLVPVLWRAIQELAEQVDGLKTQIKGNQ